MKQGRDGLDFGCTVLLTARDKADMFEPSRIALEPLFQEHKSYHSWIFFFQEHKSYYS